MSTIQKGRTSQRNTTETLKVGNPAPDFTLPTQHGESFTLSSLRGQKHAVLVFYRFAFTGV